MMLDGRGDDVSPGLSQPENRQIVGFGAAAGENNFRRAATQQSGHRFARALDGCPGLLSMMMDGRGVAEVLAEVRRMASKTSGSTGVVALLSR